MRENFCRLLLVLAFEIALLGGPSAVSVVFGQQKTPGTESDDHPSFFKVFSRDGRESFTANCSPFERLPSVEEITCEFDQIRFEPPQPDKIIFPLSVQEALKADPSLEQEAKTNPKKFEEEFNKKLEVKKHELCLSSSKIRIDLETKMRDPEFGPKRRNYAQQVIAACSDKDSTAVFRRALDMDRRTCGITVNHFALRFKKFGKRDWLYRQEGPYPSSKVAYELTGDGVQFGGHWTLTEMRIPEDGSKGKFTKTVWSWDNFSEYELPCEFISNSVVLE